MAALVLSYTLKASLAYTYYKLDPIGFIEQLCVNKDQPELGCKGKCQLKKIAASQNNKQQTPEQLIDFKQVLFHVLLEQDAVMNNLEWRHKTALPKYVNLYSFLITSNYYQPPRVSYLF